MSWEAAFRSARREPIALPEDLPLQVDLGRPELERLIPHRDPFLLLDAVTGVDSARGRVAGRRTLREEDPVFQGHFPEQPVYPGSLQLEMGGQLALCLRRLTSEGLAPAGPAGGIGEGEHPEGVRLLGVLRASFIRPILPGATVTPVAQTLEEDPLRATALVQVLQDRDICAAAVIEVCFF